jgi:hypothetical protein
MREIRRALLEADVSLPVVRGFVTRVQKRALGIKVRAACMVAGVYLLCIAYEQVHADNWNLPDFWEEATAHVWATEGRASEPCTGRPLCQHEEGSKQHRGCRKAAETSCHGKCKDSEHTATMKNTRDCPVCVTSWTRLSRPPTQAQCFEQRHAGSGNMKRAEASPPESKMPPQALPDKRQVRGCTIVSVGSGCGTQQTDTFLDQPPTRTCVPRCWALGRATIYWPRAATRSELPWTIQQVAHSLHVLATFPSMNVYHAEPGR